jgi:CSLREA domain-containing protein
MIGTRANGTSKGRALAFGFLTAALMAVCLLLTAKPAHADTIITVNSTGDAGDNNPGNGTCATAPFPVMTEPECTLRAAIEETNANNNDATVVDEIHFNIGGSGVKIISPATFLPVITESVVIDGYTEPGASANTLAAGDNAELRIRLDGPGAQGGSRGLFITANDSVVRGLSITRFGSGIDIRTADNNKIEGNFVGITPSGGDAGNGDGILISGSSAMPPDGAVSNTVGGATPQARNVISGNDSIGVAIGGKGTTGNKVMGNYIGTTKSGTGDLGNSSRGAIIYDSASDTTIGDDDPTDGLTNAANIIAFNGGRGVEVSGAASTSNGILSNSIFSNASLGIDLGGDGVTPNDGPGDADTGPNNLQNFPVISSAVTSGTKTTIKGTLESTPSQGNIGVGNTIQFFSNPRSANDEGKELIGERVVIDTDGDGIIPFTFEPPKTVKEGLFVTATATNNSTGDTSEFSAAVAVDGPPAITPLTPRPGSKTRDTTPIIRAKVTDTETNLSKSNIKLFVDGKRKTNFTYNRTTDRLTYKAGRLSFKRHTVRIVAVDGAGNVASRAWSFRVVRR